VVGRTHGVPPAAYDPRRHDEQRGRQEAVSCIAVGGGGHCGGLGVGPSSSAHSDGRHGRTPRLPHPRPHDAYGFSSWACSRSHQSGGAPQPGTHTSSSMVPPGHANGFESSILPLPETREESAHTAVMALLAVPRAVCWVCALRVEPEGASYSQPYPHSGHVVRGCSTTPASKLKVGIAALWPRMPPKMSEAEARCMRSRRLPEQSREAAEHGAHGRSVSP
jgi:hypothetical protein